MLFVFSMLIAKNAFVSATDIQDCNEFAHIHKFHFENSTKASISNDSDSCHAGNILSGPFTLTQPQFISEILITDKVSFQKFKNLIYLSPFLDLPKQPPKKSA